MSLIWSGTDYATTRRRQRLARSQGYDWPRLAWLVAGIALAALVVGLAMAGRI